MPGPLTIAGWKAIRVLKVISLTALLLATAPVFSQVLRDAPNPGAAPVNQLAIAGNACGPAALLAAFRFGNEDWQRVSNGIKGDTDKQRLSTIIREIAMRPSKHLTGRTRWSRSGVNVADLCDIANEMRGSIYLPTIRYEILFLGKGESQEQLLKRVHARLEKSLAKGLPPVISIRRFARKKDGWTIVDGHFVTVCALPKKLEKGARSFAVSYLDPWGGRRCEGTIGISNQAFLSGQNPDPTLSPCLEAVFPQALVGKSRVPAGEPTVLTLAAAIGRW